MKTTTTAAETTKKTKTTKKTSTTKLDPLASFTLYAKDLKRPMITVYPNTIHFNKESFVSLDYTPYIKILVDKAGQRIAIAKAAESELGSRKFFEHREGKQDAVRFASKEIVDLFLETAGLSEFDWGDGKKGIKFAGEKIEGAIIFNMKEQV